jgi:hypothetical protein
MSIIFLLIGLLMTFLTVVKGHDNIHISGLSSGLINLSYSIIAVATFYYSYLYDKNDV